MRRTEYSYRQHLEDLRTGTGLQKSERTRYRLLEAIVGSLEQKTFHQLRIGDVSKRAGVAEGTFYLYFQSKNDAIRAVMEGFFGFSEQLMLKSARSLDAFESIYQTTYVFVRLYQANRGLMRCFRSLNESVPDMAEVGRSANAAWFGRVAHGIVQRCDSETKLEDALFMAYALGSMIEDFLFVRYLSPDPNVKRLARTSREIAEKLAVIWYRAVYLENPKRDALLAAKAMVNIAPAPNDCAERRKPSLGRTHGR